MGVVLSFPGPRNDDGAPDVVPAFRALVLRIDELLSSGPVHLAVSREGVSGVPDLAWQDLGAQAQGAILKISHGYRHPLTFNATSLSQTLSFGGRYQSVTIPYASILAVGEARGDGLIWRGVTKV